MNDQTRENEIPNKPEDITDQELENVSGGRAGDQETKTNCTLGRCWCND